MKLFENIVHESLLLTEISQSREKDVIDAIEGMKRMRISYDDKKGGKGKKERFIFPVAYGLTKRGNKAIRAFQTAGSTKRGWPKWKLFLFDNIYSMAKEKRSFKEYAQQLIDRGFNIDGDKGMTTLFAISPLAKSDVQVSKTTDVKYDGPSIKNDIEPSTTSQQPDANQTTRFEPNKKETPSIDTLKTNNYIATSDNKTSVANNKPMTKDDVVTDKPEKTDIEISNDINNINTGSTETQLTNTENKSETKDDIRKQFNDLMNRMDNLNKEDETEADNDEKEEKF